MMLKCGKFLSFHSKVTRTVCVSHDVTSSYSRTSWTFCTISVMNVLHYLWCICTYIYRKRYLYPSVCQHTSMCIFLFQCGVLWDMDRCMVGFMRLVYRGAISWNYRWVDCSSSSAAAQQDRGSLQRQVDLQGSAYTWCCTCQARRSTGCTGRQLLMIPPEEDMYQISFMNVNGWLCDAT